VSGHPGHPLDPPLQFNLAHELKKTKKCFNGTKKVKKNKNKIKKQTVVGEWER